MTRAHGSTLAPRAAEGCKGKYMPRAAHTAVPLLAENTCGTSHSLYAGQQVYLISSRLHYLLVRIAESRILKLGSAVHPTHW